MTGPRSISERLSAALADRYRIERELGAGGMATVYLAGDLKHDRKVAIKVLKPELAAVLGAERFVQEIKTTAALSHPHILPLFDSGEAGGFLYYVMPYIEGETIRDKLNREKQFGIEGSVKIATEVADALDYAHRQGVIHRDIKPENILLHDGRPMVMDFGIALALSAAAGGRMTETGLSLGTPHYMSPEQATADRDITARSDVYSLASVLYEMLSGEPPHMGNSAQQIIMKIVTDVPRPVTELRRNVPPNVAAAVAKALEKLPADRFGSAAEFAAALLDTAGTFVRQVPGYARPPAARALLPWTVAAVAVATALLLALRPTKAPEPATLRFSIASLPEDGAGAVAVSHNGRAVAYRATRDGVARLYYRRLDDPTPVPLVGTEGADVAAFAPDDRWIVFGGADSRLKKIRLDGGTVVTLAQTTSPIGLTWNQAMGPVLGMPMMSYKYRALTYTESGDTTLRILTQPFSDSMATAKAPFWMEHDPVSVDGDRAILYTHLAPGRRRWLGVVSVADRRTTLVDLDVDQVLGFADGVLLYRDPGGTLMAVGFDVHSTRVLGQPVRVGDFAAGALTDGALSPSGTLVLRVRPNAYQVAMMDLAGQAEVILPDTISNFAARFSPDGGQVLLAADFRNTQGTWIYDLRSRSLSKPTEVGRRVGLQWTHGGQILTIGTPGPYRAAWKPRIDGPEESFSSDSGLIVGVNLASDDRTAAFATAYGEGGFNIFLHRPGDSTAIPFATTAANEGSPRFSPDDRWLAYVSDETGRLEVYVRRVDQTGDRIQVSDAGGTEPVWSPDGSHLYYRNGRALVEATLTRNGPAGQPGFSGRKTLFTGDFLAREGTLEMSRRTSYDVAPDGEHFIMARSVSGTSTEIFVWTNWISAIKQRLAEAER